MFLVKPDKVDIKWHLHGLLIIMHHMKILRHTTHQKNDIRKQKLFSQNYRKNSKNWDTLNYYRDCPTNVIVGFYSAILHSKDADRITNRVDTDKTAP